MTYSLETYARYIDVTIRDRAPNGGAVYARFKFFDSGANQSSSRAYDGTVEFGE